MIGELGRELREARRGAGLTQAQVGRAMGCSGSRVSLVERGLVLDVSLRQLARMLAAVGVELMARAYPAGSPLRDAAHLALLGRLQVRLATSLVWRTEVPLPKAGDQRAWDATITGSRFLIGVEAEMRTRDVQALDRRLALKRRDGGVDHVLLVLADTRHNRALMREFGATLRVNYPLPGDAILEALSAGGDPGGSGIVLL
jgi:transcriptional regulator with XRE-family HTH domain